MRYLGSLPVLAPLALVVAALYFGSTATQAEPERLQYCPGASCLTCEERREFFANPENRLPDPAPNGCH
jgi:hypothetical protein